MKTSIYSEAFRNAVSKMTFSEFSKCCEKISPNTRDILLELWIYDVPTRPNSPEQCVAPSTSNVDQQLEQLIASAKSANNSDIFNYGVNCDMKHFEMNYCDQEVGSKDVRLNHFINAKDSDSDIVNYGVNCDMRHFEMNYCEPEGSTCDSECPPHSPETAIRIQPKRQCKKAFNYKFNF